MATAVKMQDATLEVVNFLLLHVKKMYFAEVWVLLFYLRALAERGGWNCACKGEDHSLSISCFPRQAFKISSLTLNKSGFLDNMCNWCSYPKVTMPFNMLKNCPEVVGHVFDVVHGHSDKCKDKTGHMLTIGLSILWRPRIASLLGAPEPAQDGTFPEEELVNWLRTPVKEHITSKLTGGLYNMHLCIVVEHFLRPTTSYTPHCSVYNTKWYGKQRCIQPMVSLLDGVLPIGSKSTEYFTDTRQAWSVLGGGPRVIHTNTITMKLDTLFLSLDTAAIASAGASTNAIAQTNVAHTVVLGIPSIPNTPVAPSHRIENEDGTVPTQYTASSASEVLRYNLASKHTYQEDLKEMLKVRLVLFGREKTHITYARLKPDELFIVNRHQHILKLLETVGGAMAEVYNPDRKEWAVEPTSTPWELGGRDCILIRDFKLNNAQCEGLDKEILMLGRPLTDHINSSTTAAAPVQPSARALASASTSPLLAAITLKRKASTELVSSIAKDARAAVKGLKSYDQISGQMSVGKVVEEGRGKEPNEPRSEEWKSLMAKPAGELENFGVSMPAETSRVKSENGKKYYPYGHEINGVVHLDSSDDE